MVQLYLLLSSHEKVLNIFHISVALNNSYLYRFIVYMYVCFSGFQRFQSLVAFLGWLFLHSSSINLCWLDKERAFHNLHALKPYIANRETEKFYSLKSSHINELSMTSLHLCLRVLHLPTMSGFYISLKIILIPSIIFQKGPLWRVLVHAGM